MATVYDTIGGRDLVTTAVDLFSTRVLADRLLRPHFTGTDMRAQKARMRAFFTAALGGHDVHRGRDMRAAHAHMSVSDEAFDRISDHLVWTLEALAVPVAQPLREAA